MNFFASCPKGIEALLANELNTLGAAEIKETRAGVFFSSELATIYRICLWSRLANQIFLPLLSCPVENTNQLYEIALHFAWEEHMSVDNTFAIHVDIINSITFKNAQFAMQRFKDGLADYWRYKTGRRPNVQTKQPDFTFHVLIKKEEVTLSLNLTGDSLHKRGFRLEGGSAPLKENLAAAILIRAHWPAIAAQGGSLFDPLCGSATLLIEGAYMAANIAPGFLRDYFGFLHWQEFKPALWRQLKQEAAEKREEGLAHLPKIIGYDADRATLRIAQENIERAGLTKYIHLERRELAQCEALNHVSPGLLVTNPPYGERLGELETLKFTYQHLGEIFKKHFRHWQCSVFTGNVELAKALKLGPEDIYKFFNGPIPCQLLNFLIRDKKTSEKIAALQKSEIENKTIPTEGSDFANRLKKNLQKLAPLAEKNHTRCYRLYDTDLPDYAVAIDRYENFVHIQEYAPPKTIDPEKAQKRLQLALDHTAHILQVSHTHIFLKTRAKQKGKAQYQKQNHKGEFHTVEEQGVKFLVNFTDYLDTGLFLDTRLVRQWILEQVKGKNFLNLFCYTGSATVYAALGKAASTTSIDLSATYLAWAKRNLALNGIAPKHHHFVQADCLEWLKEQPQKFDLILLDPPSFSNSKRMQDTLDIERDHPELITLAMKHLVKGGTLIFVTNKRNFNLEPELKTQFSVEDMTHKTLPFDFKRHVIHHTFLIRALT